MSKRKREFSLVATVSTNSGKLIRPVLERLVGKRKVKVVSANEFRIVTTMKAENAKELNRAMLSELRRIEKKTRLRAEWTADRTTERFFDYVLKKRI
jgi:ERCC4-type nuclease